MEDGTGRGAGGVWRGWVGQVGGGGRGRKRAWRGGGGGGEKGGMHISVAKAAISQCTLDNFGIELFSHVLRHHIVTSIT